MLSSATRTFPIACTVIGLAGADRTAVESGDGARYTGETDSTFIGANQMPSLRSWIASLPRRNAIVLAGIVLLALAARIGVAALTTSWAFSDADHHFGYGHEMGQIGAALALDEGFAWPGWGKFAGRPTAWMAPAYPWLIGQTFALLGTYSVPAALALLAFQILVSALTCVLLYLVGRRIFGTGVGLLAALMYALFPQSIHFSAQKIWSTPLYVLCLLAVVYLVLRLVDRPSLRAGVVLGLALGLTALVDALIFAALPLLFAWFWFASPADRGKTILSLVSMAVVMALIIAPWLVRNYRVFDHATFIRTNFGNELFMGNNPLATGSVDDHRVTGDRIAEILSDEELAYLRVANEAEYNRFLLGKAVDYIRDDPARFLQLTATRFVRFWTTIKPPVSFQEKVAFVTYLAVLILALMGLAKSRLNRGVVLILILLMSLPVPYYLTLAVHVRYRFPIVPLLMLFAAHALIVGWCRWQVRRLEELA